MTDRMVGKAMAHLLDLVNTIRRCWIDDIPNSDGFFLWLGVRDGQDELRQHLLHLRASWRTFHDKLAALQEKLFDREETLERPSGKPLYFRRLKISASGAQILEALGGINLAGLDRDLCLTIIGEIKDSGVYLVISSGLSNLVRISSSPSSFQSTSFEFDGKLVNPGVIVFYRESLT